VARGSGSAVGIRVARDGGRRAGSRKEVLNSSVFSAMLWETVAEDIRFSHMVVNGWEQDD
jgi:hypothetical protein